MCIKHECLIDLEKVTNSLEADLFRAEEKICELNDDIDGLHKENQKLEDSLEKMTDRCTDAEAQLEEADMEIDRLFNKLDELEGRIVSPEWEDILRNHLNLNSWEIKRIANHPDPDYAFGQFFRGRIVFD